MKSILVVGGCGYIGSHMVKALLEAGHRVTVLDDLSTGHRDSLLGGTLVIGDFGNSTTLDALFSQQQIDGIIHFASLIQVGESMINPGRYYGANAYKTLTLLEAMVRHHIKFLVFSSSAAVFGEPQYIPIDEEHPCNPISPYGKSKLFVEMMLQDFERAHGLKSVALRYFNAAGADPAGRIGERHEPESHLIPLAIGAALGSLPPLRIFGNDYDTPDGTCIRDYVHVDDLCAAHLLALNYLFDGGARMNINLGNGSGFSVQQVIETVERISNRPVPKKYTSRRDGDPARLIADASRAKSVLDWQPRHADLNAMIGHALNWEKRRTP